MDPDTLGERLASILEEVTPDGIHVRYEEGQLLYYNDLPGAYGGSDDPSRPSSGSPWRDGWPEHVANLDDLVELCTEVLRQLQDHVDEMTATPWPGHTFAPSAEASSSDPDSVELRFLYPEHPELDPILVGRLRLTD